MCMKYTQSIRISSTTVNEKASLIHTHTHTYIYIVNLWDITQNRLLTCTDS